MHAHTHMHMCASPPHPQRVTPDHHHAPPPSHHAHCPVACRLCDMFSKEGDVPPRTRFMRYAIRSPRYGVEYGSTLLILLISLVFALISPLIVLFGAMFCGGMWVYWR